MKPESSRPVSHSDLSAQTSPGNAPAPPGKHAFRKAQSLDSALPMLSPETRKAKRETTRLAKRDISIKKSGIRFADWLAKGTIQLLSPLISAGVEMGFSQDEKRLQSNVRFDQNRLSRLQATLEERNSQLASLQLQLDELKPQLKEGNEEVRKEFLQTLEQYSQTLNSCFSLKKDLRYARSMLAKNEQKLAQFQKDAPKTKKLVTKNLNVMLSLFTGLRSAYSTLQGTASHTACKVTLPPVYFYDSSGTEYALKDVEILVDKMTCDDEGNFVLSIPRCSVTVARGTGDDAPPERVSVNLGLMLEVKPPIGQSAEKLLACGLSSMKSAGTEMSDQVQKFFDEGKRSVTDFVDVSFDQASVITASSDEHPLITQAAVNSLLQVFSPLLNNGRRHMEKKLLQSLEQAHDDAERGQHLYREYVDKYQHLIDDTDQLVGTLDGKEMFPHQLAGMLPKLRHQKEKFAIQKQLSEGGLITKKHRLLVQKNRVAASNNPKQSTLHNLVQTFFGVQKVMDAQPDSAPVSLNFAEQHFQLSPTTEVVLKNTKAEIKAISLDESGTLLVDIPELTTSMELTHEGQVHSMPGLKLEGIALKVSPPLGRVMFEAANFEFPVTMGKMIALLSTYESATTKNNSEDGFLSPKRVSDYCQLSLKNSACTINGELKPVTASPEREKLPFEEPLETLFLKTMGLDDTGCQQVTNTLAMAALGAPPPQASLEENTSSLTDEEPSSVPEPVKPKTFPGQPPRLELEASPDELFGEMSALKRWVVGSDSFRIQFSSRRSNGKTVLEKTRVHLPKTNSALRRFVLKRMVRKALKKRTIRLARDPQQPIHLNPILPRRKKPAVPRQER